MAINKYKSPPGLIGYNYSLPEIIKTRKKKGLLAIRLETSLACNYKCIYCNGEAGRKKPGEISYAIMRRVIRESKKLGAKSVIIIGGGEPTLYPRFRDLVAYIARQRMTPVVITNGSQLSLGLCRFLYEKQASVLIKLDSLKRSIQDYLSQKKGSFALISKGLDHLFKVGFAKGSNERLRCGASFVVTKKNYREIPQIWKFCRENNLYPNLEDFIPTKRGLLNYNKLYIPKKSVFALKRKLLRLDHGYGYDWLVHSPLPGHGCLQFYYSIYIAADGWVRPCSDVGIEYFNVKDRKIKDILRTSFFKKMRFIDEHLQGKCRLCRYKPICVGCRGNAFCIGIQEGLDPSEAVCREDPLCCKDPNY